MRKKAYDPNHDTDGFYVLRRKHQRKYDIDYEKYGYSETGDAWLNERILRTFDLLLPLEGGGVMPFGEILERNERGEDVKYNIF